MSEKTSYEERACCETGSFVPSESCPATPTQQPLSGPEPVSGSSNTGAIVGGVVGTLVVVLVLAGLLYWRRKGGCGDGGRGVVERMNSHGDTAIEVTGTIIPEHLKFKQSSLKINH